MSHHPFETHGTTDGRTIHSQQQFPGCWVATTDEYDGPGSPIGHGQTEEEAVASLLEKLEDE